MIKAVRFKVWGSLLVVGIVFWSGIYLGYRIREGYGIRVGYRIRFGCERP